MPARPEDLASPRPPSHPLTAGALPPDPRMVRQWEGECFFTAPQLRLALAEMLREGKIWPTGNKRLRTIDNYG